MVIAPALFVAGVVFTLPHRPAGGGEVPPGLQLGQFDNLVQAKPLYSFEVLTMGAIGLAFSSR